MNHNEWVKIIKAMKQSKRPTLHGQILRNIDLEYYSNLQYFLQIVNFENFSFGCFAKDYLLKSDNTLRGNS